jgi:hypothetical protein
VPIGFLPKKPGGLRDSQNPSLYGHSAYDFFLVFAGMRYIIGRVGLAATRSIEILLQQTIKKWNAKMLVMDMSLQGKSYSVGNLCAFSYYVNWDVVRSFLKVR